jgi:hypothetical protein
VELKKFNSRNDEVDVEVDVEVDDNDDNELESR